MEEKVVFNSEDVNNNKVFGILSYLGFLVLVPILAVKDSMYSKFHANQGLVLFIFEFASWLITIIVSFILQIFFNLLHLTVIATLLAGILTLIVTALTLVFTIIGIVNACSGEAKQLPLIGGITLLK